MCEPLAVSTTQLKLRNWKGIIATSNANVTVKKIPVAYAKTNEILKMNKTTIAQ